jgi:hypothetical protein
MPLPDKPRLVETVRLHLQAQYNRIAGAASEARGYATDPGSKAESKYDTRSLEASYLAIGQAEQAEALAEALADFDLFDWPEFAPDDRIGLGALVELDFEGDRVFCLLAPRGGGVTCQIEEGELTVLTPQAPLFERIAGRRAGETLTGPPVKIVSVQ